MVNLRMLRKSIKRSRLNIFPNHKYYPGNKIRRIQLITTILLLPATWQSMRGDAYSDYIAAYSEMAMSQQEEYGIPASITLAQGLLESAAGRSTLAREGNNHFGIKCHADWQGASMLRDDDAPDECFRVYENAEESFRDHSIFLTRRRYQPLFEYEVTDYASWARGLSRCGYATDPNYADRLITIIERYSLYLYDKDGGHVENGADFILESLQRSHIVRKGRGLHYIIATPEDTYGSIAREFRIPLDDLLRYNDCPTDGQVRAWEEVYLQEKHTDGPSGIKWATIGEDETLRTVAQRFGVKMESLQRKNPGIKDEPGTRLRL